MSAGAPLVFAITGASGAPYAVRLLEQLVRAKRDVWLIVSSHGQRLLATECGMQDLDALRARTGGAAGWKQSITVFDDGDRGARPASGSAKSAGMVICPCSMGTLAAIAAGTSRSLVERAADVALKERRALLLVTRETPLSAIHLRNMLTLREAGATILFLAPGFYHGAETVENLVDFIVARALDQLGLDQALMPRWGQT